MMIRAQIENRKTTQKFKNKFLPKLTEKDYKIQNRKTIEKNLSFYKWANLNYTK